MKIIDLQPENTGTIERAAEILVAAFKPHHPHAWPDMNAGIAEVQAFFSPNRIIRIAINDEDKILGWIGAISEYDGHAWELHPLVVHPSYQGQGIGQALVADLENLIQERGAITMFLGTDDEDNQTSLAGIDLYPDVQAHIQNIKNINRHPFEFYQKLGFVIVGVIPDANGFGKPDIFMAKRVGK